MAQLLGVASLPLLSRIFAADDFGSLTSFTLLHALGLSFITLRIDWLIPNSRTEAEAKRLGNAGVTMLAVFVLTFTAAVLFTSPQLNSLIHQPARSIAAFALPLSLLLAGAFLLMQAQAVYSGDLGATARAKITQAVTTLAVSIILGLWIPSGTSLIVAYTVGLMAAVLSMPVELRGLLQAATHATGRSFNRLLKVHGGQLSSSTLLSIINVLANSSPLILLTAYYDATIVGWYGLAFRMATAPIGVVTTAMSQSFWTEAASLARYDPAALRRFYLGNIKRLSLIGLPFAATFLSAPFYLPGLLGETEWSGSGIILAAITPYLFGMIVFSPTNHLIVYRKSHWQAGIDLASFVASLAVFAVLASRGSEAWIALLGTSLVLLAGYLCRFAAHLRANTLHATQIMGRG